MTSRGKYNIQTANLCIAYIHFASMKYIYNLKKINERHLCVCGLRSTKGGLVTWFWGPLSWVVLYANVCTPAECSYVLALSFTLSHNRFLFISPPLVKVKKLGAFILQYCTVPPPPLPTLHHHHPSLQHTIQPTYVVTFHVTHVG